MLNRDAGINVSKEAGWNVCHGCWIAQVEMIPSGEFDRIARMMVRVRWWMKRLKGMQDGDLDGVAGQNVRQGRRF